MTNETPTSSVAPETLAEINSWDHDTALANLQGALQLAVEIELSITWDMAALCNIASVRF